MGFKKKVDVEIERKFLEIFKINTVIALATFIILKILIEVRGVDYWCPVDYRGAYLSYTLSSVMKKKKLIKIHLRV